MSEGSPDLHTQVAPVTRYCAVCQVAILMQSGTDAPALCIVHYFVEDPTEDWERD